VYTDSAADLPILARGARRIVVNPKPAHHKRIVAKLGNDVEVVEWR
jgi:phosphoserine phosphatase